MTAESYPIGKKILKWKMDCKNHGVLGKLSIDAHNVFVYVETEDELPCISSWGSQDPAVVAAVEAFEVGVGYVDVV